jgi:superfamily I DNA and/or RNA helicase
VTPFRAQATRIRELLAQRGHGKFAEVRIGTAHTFQGGELARLIIRRWF